MVFQPRGPHVEIAGSSRCSAPDPGYTLVSGGPPLDNIIVIGGQSVGRGERLERVGGTLSVRACLSRMFIDGTPNNDDDLGNARVMLKNCDAVEGFVVALCHDPEELELVAIDVGDDAGDAEFAAVEISEVGGTLGEIFDVEPPFDGQTLAAGTNNIAIYDYDRVRPSDTAGPRSTSDPRARAPAPSSRRHRSARGRRAHRTASSASRARPC